MTEREKMLAGELYDCGDPELLSRWHEAKDLILLYNATKIPGHGGKESDFGAAAGRTGGKTCGSHRPSMWTMEITFILETTVKSI